MRLGTLALIMPVMTSTDGRCVASSRWMPTARDFCARRMIASSTSAGETIMRSASSSITTSMYGSGGLPSRSAHAVHLGQVARLVQPHQLVARLHLAHDVLEHRGGVLHVRDDGREQVRDRLVVVELDLLGVDQDHPHLLRRGAQQDRAEHRVDAARLARAGRAGDQHVRHAREVGEHGVAGDVLAEPDGERRAGRGLVDEIAERDEVGRAVGHLDADRLLAGDRREDADLGRRERVGEVVAQRATRARPWCRARAAARSGSRAGPRRCRSGAPRRRAR